MPNTLFDNWAPHYDNDVQQSDEDQKFPFAGYHLILDDIFNRVMQNKSQSVLDIGIGSGTLSKRLYDQGLEITGIDNSSEMLNLSKEKMPNGTFIEFNFEEGLPQEIQENTFDAIVSTYALHHLNDEKKVSFIQSCLERLNENGLLLIGDISFNSRTDEKMCHLNHELEWDDQEYYLINEELIEVFPEIKFEQKSFCGGLFEISK